nr:hypothetical protein [Bacteroidota bacterium]
MNNKLLYRIATAYSDNIYRFTLLSVIFVLLGLFLFRLLLIFSYNAEIGGIDNNFVYGVLQNIKGYDLYTNPEEFPYAITLYSPLYYNVCTVIGKIVHINADEPIHIYQLC